MVKLALMKKLTNNQPLCYSVILSVTTRKSYITVKHNVAQSFSKKNQEK